MKKQKVVRLLVERGCVVDRMDDGQRTPLIYAAAAHNVAVMRWVQLFLFLERGG